LPRFARNDKWRFYRHCEEQRDMATWLLQGLYLDAGILSPQLVLVTSKLTPKFNMSVISL
jgi:hypothetical protein